MLSPASAWGPDGHRIVGSIADQLLNANAKQQIASLLGVDLRTAAPWLDCVKSVQRQADGSLAYVTNPQFEPPCMPFANDHGAMIDYVGRNWIDCVYPEDVVDEKNNRGCHQTYHFDDVAVQRNRFDRNYVGTNDHDLVSAINAAVAALLGRPAPPPFSIKDKKEALFMLAHLVGDIAQPLHVGALYLDEKGTPTDLDVTHTIDPSTETAGGNFIFDGDKALHVEWDLGDTAPLELVAVAKGVSPDHGRIENWAADWASDTILVAQEALAGTSYTRTGDKKWSVAFVDRAAYERAADAIKRRQLAKAGARLAEIMNTIWP
jgi:hypothetical protein